MEVSLGVLEDDLSVILEWIFVFLALFQCGYFGHGYFYAKFRDGQTDRRSARDEEGPLAEERHTRGLWVCAREVG